MTNSSFEAPDELRDFTECGGEQAREAFEGFAAVARGEADGAECADPSLISVGSDLLGCAEPSANAAIELASKPCRTEDAHEAFVLQSEYLKAPLAALQALAKNFDAAIQNSV